jgi:hypothetical protein
MSTEIIQQELQGLDPNTSTYIQSEFAEFFGHIDGLKEKLSTIQVSDISQTAEMQQARDIRLELKNLRISADKTRKRLKEDSLRYGKAVQGVYNVLEFIIAPLEKQAEEQEKFVEIQSMKLRAERKAKREIEVSNYTEFIPTSIDLSGLTEEEFQNLLAGAKLQLQNKIEAEAKAEAERIERERVEAEQREAMRLDNERLRKEAEEQAVILAKQREEMEKQKREMEAKAKKLLEEQEKKLAKEREEKAKVEAELRAKQEAEEKAKREEQQRIEAEEKARIQSEKKAQREPDKKKLENLAFMLEVYQLPEMKTEEGKKVVDNVKTLLGKVVTYIRDNNSKI